MARTVRLTIIRTAIEDFVHRLAGVDIVRAILCLLLSAISTLLILFSASALMVGVVFLSTSCSLLMNVARDGARCSVKLLPEGAKHVIRQLVAAAGVVYLVTTGVTVVALTSMFAASIVLVWTSIGVALCSAIGWGLAYWVRVPR